MWGIFWVTTKIQWACSPGGGGGGGGVHSVSYWVGVCRWHWNPDPEESNQENMIPCSRLFVLIWDPVQDWTSNISRVLRTWRHAPTRLLTVLTRKGSDSDTDTDSDSAGSSGNKYPVQDKHVNCIPCLRRIPENHTLSSGTSPYRKYRGVQNITFVCFVKERTSVNFNSERKCCGVDQMFLKDVANAQPVLRVSCPNWETFVRN